MGADRKCVGEDQLLVSHEIMTAAQSYMLRTTANGSVSHAMRLTPGNAAVQNGGQSHDIVHAKS